MAVRNHWRKLIRLNSLLTLNGCLHWSPWHTVIYLIAKENPRQPPWSHKKSANTLQVSPWLTVRTTPTQPPASCLPLLLFLKNPSTSEMKKINIKKEIQMTYERFLVQCMTHSRCWIHASSFPLSSPPYPARQDKLPVTSSCFLTSETQATTLHAQITHCPRKSAHSY